MRRLFLNAHLLDHANGLNAKGGVLVDDSRIVAVGPQVTNANATPGVQVTDCKGRILTPGFIDMRVFTGEPGNEHRETLASASLASASPAIGCTANAYCVGFGESELLSVAVFLRRFFGGRQNGTYKSAGCVGGGRDSGGALHQSMRAALGTARSSPPKSAG